jgi:hypothetical protein
MDNDRYTAAQLREMAKNAKEKESRDWWEGFGEGVRVTLTLVALVLIISYFLLYKYWCY